MQHGAAHAAVVRLRSGGSRMTEWEGEGAEEREDHLSVAREEEEGGLPPDALKLTAEIAESRRIAVPQHVIDSLLGPDAAHSSGAATPIHLYNRATRIRIRKGRLRLCEAPQAGNEQQGAAWCARGLRSWLRSHDVAAGDALVFSSSEPVGGLGGAGGAGAAAGAAASNGGEGAPRAPPRVYVELVRKPAHAAPHQQQTAVHTAAAQPVPQHHQQQRQQQAGGAGLRASRQGTSARPRTVQHADPCLVTMSSELTWLPKRTMAALLGSEEAASGSLQGTSGLPEVPLRLPPGQQHWAPTAVLKCVGTPAGCKSARWMVARLSGWLKRIRVGHGSTFRFRAVLEAAAPAAAGGTTGSRVVAVKIMLAQAEAAVGAAAGGPAQPHNRAVPKPEKQQQVAGQQQQQQQQQQAAGGSGPALPSQQQQMQQQMQAAARVELPERRVKTGGTPPAAAPAEPGLRRSGGSGGWKPYPAAQLAPAGAAGGSLPAHGPATPAAAAAAAGSKRSASEQPGGGTAPAAAGTEAAAVPVSAARLALVVKKRYPKAYRTTLSRTPAVLPLEALQLYIGAIGWQSPEMEFERKQPAGGAVAAAGSSAGGGFGATYEATVTLQSSDRCMHISATGQVAADKATARQLAAAACLQQLLVLGVRRKRIGAATKSAKKRKQTDQEQAPKQEA
ncbi:hypothetical protein HXX76_014653 [Chlamydomonas incerta]|uniref:Uncharacterized protein n=1 Tax=Chlamydomonas incerta TaxID=51695 RepID=A0A835SP73_CHLIN|nr:hypothetical protein HXX76_014653 [Chlamydomonas incerta]|eukprot:KAG2424275.1 hypothetical protein HXX76_014653 [Chlamydomonas incerta]